MAHIGLDNHRMVTSYLNDIYNTVVMKDVISRESIRNVRFLNDLVRFVSDNIGKNISANSISKFMEVAEPDNLTDTDSELPEIPVQRLHHKLLQTVRHSWEKTV